MKDLILEIKESVVNNSNKENENFIKSLAESYGISFGEVNVIYKNISDIYDGYKNALYSQSKKRLWCEQEDNFLMDYVDYCLIMNKEENIKKMKKGEMLSDVSEILFERSTNSVQFRYYELRNSDEFMNVRNEKDNDMINLFIRLFHFNDNMIKKSISKNKTVAEVEFVSEVEVEDTDDLLNIVVDLVENIEILDLDVNGLFKGLLAMSNTAMINNSEINEMNFKIKNLEDENSSLLLELDKEKKSNDIFQSEMFKISNEFEKLRAEVYMFEKLNGKNKLKELNSFEKNIRNMISNFDKVINI